MNKYQIRYYDCLHIKECYIEACSREEAMRKFRDQQGKEIEIVQAQCVEEYPIIFRNAEHEAFYQEHLTKCRCPDVYHKALVYCLGIERDTREHVDQIYDFATGLVKPDCLKEGWQTSGSERVVRLAFNLYCNGTPSVDDYRKKDEQLRECRNYTVEELFCCGFARYFWEAVKIRYPEYCYSRYY